MPSPDPSTPQSSSEDTIMTDSPDTSYSPRESHPPLPTPIPRAAPSTIASPLLALPRELRDRIYTFALTSISPFWYPNPTTDHHIEPNLLLASRQVYAEAAPILYSSNKFLFTHPSDCNMFRVVASPYSEHITSVCFRIREKDLRIWTSYLSSSSETRSLHADLPRLKSLWIFLRCGSWGPPAMMFPAIQWAAQQPNWQNPFPPQQNQQQNQPGNQIPVPPPPPGAPGGANPPVVVHNAGAAHLIDRFYRWDRDQGLENLVLSLQGKTHDAEVKIVAIQRLLRQDVRTLSRAYPDDLILDKQGDARTRFKRVRGVEISLELSAVEPVQVP
ncbi:uncharacterized protein BDZ99DRAFT_457933 [Mytilinidion resinicola]|uniref:Uncharacterized protein n=1 Tax=Mytilinidion resinicola TaxID=574789 RepID=A0A6A6Z4E4_9PEZI|nr:uncharacterized protein BDZ99DRAFT_457933 [Mytilinidion resinicola]KAF2816012.1 hypothetical protein BDZ99DRAFT_457933 [Mytilinidion resinicola]